MKKIYLYLSVIIFILSVFGCLSQPDKKDYIGRPDACYDAASCMYLNSKNPDKSICMDAYKECRAYGRFIFCKDEKNLPDGINFSQCQLYLNQK